MWKCRNLETVKTWFVKHVKNYKLWKIALSVFRNLSIFELLTCSWLRYFRDFEISKLENFEIVTVPKLTHIWKWPKRNNMKLAEISKSRNNKIWKFEKMTNDKIWNNLRFRLSTFWYVRVFDMFVISRLPRFWNIEKCISWTCHRLDNDKISKMTKTTKM